MGKKFKASIKLFNYILKGILEIIYPRENYCIICGEEDYIGICKRCRNSIKRVNNYNNNIESYGYYGGVLKELILKFKYYNNFTAGDILAELLVDYIKKEFFYKDFIITYIPLSKKSKKKRGFNQCQYIANKIGHSLDIVCMEVLIKTKENKEQKLLNYTERYENIKDVFELKRNVDIKNLKLILIDDVTTSGATIDEACKILKKYGVKDIKLLTLAKSQI